MIVFDIKVKRVMLLCVALFFFDLFHECRGAYVCVVWDVKQLE